MRLIIVIGILLLPISSWGQEFQLTTRRITAQEGLVGDNVYCALQDEDGYLWFGTETGVSRYNGKEFDNFHLADGLGDNEVFRIDQDSQGRIWFSGFNGQLSYYQAGKFHNPRNDSILSKVAFTSHYTNLYEDSKGNMWFTTNLKVARITVNGEVNLVDLVEGQAPYVTTFMERNGEIWGFSPRRLTETKFQDAHGFVQNLTASRVDNVNRSFGTYLSGKKTHLTQFDFKVSSDYVDDLIANKDFEVPRISKIHNDQEHGLWLCTYAGLVFYDKFKETANKYLTDYIVTHVLKDREGGYWITTLGDGVLYASSLKYKSISQFENHEINAITSLVNYSGTISFGGVGGTFGKFEDDGVRIAKGDLTGRLMTKSIAPGLRPNTFVLAVESELIERSHDRILRTAPFAAKYVLKWRGNYVIGDRKTILIVKPSQLDRLFNMDFYEVRDARVLDGNSGLTEFVQKETAYIIDIEPYREGLLVGTAEGLYYLDENLEYTKVSEHPLMNVRINDVAVHNDDYVLSTHGSGLLLKVQNEWKQLTVADKLTSNIVRKTVYQDENQLWVATNGGVSRIEIDGNEVQINSLNKNNGLNSEQVFDLLVREDELILGTAEGISVVSVDDWAIEDVPPLLNVSVLTEQGTVEQPDGASFDYGFRNLEFRYDGIHFRSFEDIVYEYRLSGRDENWVQTDQRSVNFGGLNPGSYDFQVKAISAFGTQSEVTSIHFTILRPFWATWWFLLISLALLVFIIIRVTSNFYQRRRNKEQKEFEFKLRIAEAERRALQSQLNPHFIFNSLNSVQRMVLKNEPQTAYDYLERFSKLIRRVLKLSEKSSIPLSDELDTLRLYVELENQRLKDKFDFEIQVADNVDLGRKVPSLMIQPYVENSIWHGIMPLEGTRRGRLEIAVYQSDTQLSIEIKDNGVGRPPAIREEAMGTNIVKNLMSNISVDRIGLVNVEDLKENGTPMGTKVTLQIAILELDYDKSFNYR